MQSKVHPTYKTKYRVANWVAYNKALVRRGALGGTVIYGAWIPGIAVVAGLRSGVPVGVGVFCLLPAVAVASLVAVEREAAIVRIVSPFLALRQAPLVARARLARQRNNIATVLENVQRWIERTEA